VATDRPLIMTVERFLRESGMAATTFGRLALGDPRFVFDHRQGRETGLRVRCRAEHFMNITRSQGFNHRPAPASGDRRG
jgi:hypothetical protein